MKTEIKKKKNRKKRKKRKQGKKWRYSSRIFPVLQILIFGIAYIYREQLPPVCLEHCPVCTHSGWQGRPWLGAPAAGTCQDAGSGLYNRIHFYMITSGCSPEDRSCKVLNTLAPIQKIIYTHEECTQVEDAFLSFPWFSSDGIVLLFKSFLFCAWWEWPSLISHIFVT